MPEILTESFCERCGTRYTFESAAPPKVKKLGKFKTLSKGLKNYVLSDETSMDEAMAAARSDEERALTSQHLDAFHSTFNFCMTCRQYTCANCWNQAEGLCLTCAPASLTHEFPVTFLEQTPFVTPEPLVVEPSAWPTSDTLPGASATPILDEVIATNGATAPDMPAEPVTASAWPVEAEQAAAAEAESDAIAAAGWEAAEQAAGVDAEGDATGTWPIGAESDADAEIVADAEPEIAPAAEVTADAEPEVVSTDAWADAEQVAGVEAERDAAQSWSVDAAGWPIEADPAVSDAEAEESAAPDPVVDAAAAFEPTVTEPFEAEPMVSDATEAQPAEAEPLEAEPLEAEIEVAPLEAEPAAAALEIPAWLEVDNEALTVALARAHGAAEAGNGSANAIEADGAPEQEVFEAAPALDDAAVITPETTAPADDLDARAALTASRTSALLASLRPGANIDAELEAYEASVEPEPIVDEPEPIVDEQVPAEPVALAQTPDATVEGLPPELVAVIGPAIEAAPEPVIEGVTEVPAAVEVEAPVVLEVAAEVEAIPEVAVEAQPETAVEALPPELAAVIPAAIVAAPEPGAEVVTDAPVVLEVAAELEGIPEVAPDAQPETPVEAMPPELVAVIGAAIVASPEPAVEVVPDAPVAPWVAAEVEVAPEIDAAEPVELAAPPVAPEPVELAAPPVAPEPEPEPVRADLVEQPTWRIVAPAAPAPLVDGHQPTPAPAPAPAQPPVAATVVTPPAPAVEPQWPVHPQLIQADPSFLASRQTAAAAATDAVWAASSRNVVDRPAGAPAGGVQTCTGCGLSLSATARFCRRCGNRQGA